MQQNAKNRKRVRRYPGGYGLPSLVIVLFFVSVRVTEITNAVAQETVEARATAAMNIVEDRLHAFEVTGGDGTGLLPHLVPSQNVTVGLVQPAPGQPPRLEVEPTFNPGPEAVLFDQQLRVFLNVPADVEIGTIAQDTLRRKHPERVFRSGDRMGAPLEMNGDPAAPASVLNVGETRSGTAHSESASQVETVLGLPESLVQASELIETQQTIWARIFGRFRWITIWTRPEVFADTVEISESVSVEDASIAGAAVAARVEADDMEVTGFLRGGTADIADARAIGSFATDTLDRQDRVYFGRVVVSGLRSEAIRSNSIDSTEWFGPQPGQLSGEIQPVDPETLFAGQPEPGSTSPSGPGSSQDSYQPDRGERDDWWYRDEPERGDRR